MATTRQESQAGKVRWLRGEARRLAARVDELEAACRAALDAFGGEPIGGARDEREVAKLEAVLNLTWVLREGASS